MLSLHLMLTKVLTKILSTELFVQNFDKNTIQGTHEECFTFSNKKNHFEMNKKTDRQDVRERKKERNRCIKSA